MHFSSKRHEAVVEASSELTHLLRMVLPDNTRELQPHMLQRQQHWGSSSAAEQCGIWRRRFHAMLQHLYDKSCREFRL
jgi:hypothetical protein